MWRLVEFPLEGGGSVLLEVEEPELEGGYVKAAQRGEIEKASQNFEAALEKVRPAATAVISKLKEIIPLATPGAIEELPQAPVKMLLSP